MIEESNLNDYINDIEDILESPVQMNTANETISIYRGLFVMKYEKIEIIIQGNIQYKWNPSIGVVFEGVTTEFSNLIIKTINDIEHFEVVVNDENYGTAIISNLNISNQISIKGVFRHTVITGEKTIPVSKIKFCIPNFREFLGISVKKITKSNRSTLRNRLILENDKYKITIDKRFEYKKLYSSVTENGGYIITHSGELISKKGALTFENSKEILHCLNLFLSFLNGKRTSAILIHGIFDNEKIWCDYSNYYVDRYDDLPSWINSHSIEYINELWQVFSKKWKNKNDKDVLNTAIHWYLECNKSSGFVEGSLIMAQTALELLYNWYIIENKKLLIGKDSENINAANKIRLLLSQLNLNYTIPKKFTYLDKFLKDEKLVDAPEAVVQIRNAIVHSQEEKRAKLNKIENMAKYEALQVCIWYIEVALLKILDYKGDYTNRCSEQIVRSAKREKLL